MYSKTTLIARYAETDQMGVVHHSVYPVWYEAARTDWIKRLGMSYTQMEQLGIMLPLRDLQCHYLRAAKYEDVLTVTARLQSLSYAKCTFVYEVFVEGQPSPINLGSTTHGFVDRATFRPMNLKKAHPQVYALLEQSMERSDESK